MPCKQSRHSGGFNSTTELNNVIVNHVRRVQHLNISAVTESVTHITTSLCSDTYVR